MNKNERFFKDTVDAQDKLRTLRGDFYGWEELIPYYLSLACSKKGRKAASILEGLSIDYDAPYIVTGNKDSLRLFVTYYLKTRGTVRRGFSRYNLKDFAFQYDSDDKFPTNDILFLTSGKYETYYGNTTRTLVSNIMNTVMRRQEEGQVTILLLESPIQEFMDISEFKKIDLYQLLNIKKTAYTGVSQGQAVLTQTGQDNLVEQFLSKYNDLGELSRPEQLASMPLLRQGNFEQAYRNIQNIRKIS